MRAWTNFEKLLLENRKVLPLLVFHSPYSQNYYSKSRKFLLKMQIGCGGITHILQGALLKLLTATVPENFKPLNTMTAGIGMAKFGKGKVGVIR